MPSPAWKSIHLEFESLKRDNSRHSDTSCYWYRSRNTGQEYCLLFDTHSPPPELIYNSLKSPLLSESKTNTIHVSRDYRIEECSWRPYMEPPFNASGLSTIDHTELILSKTIQPGVDVVQVRGDTTVYIHKYMTPNCFPASFNIEVNNYTKLGDSPYVPDLVAVITKNNENRGLLLSAIDGDDLSELTLTLIDKWSVTAKLLHALVDLESRSYFPQDLKPGNIMLRSVDRSLVIIDLGDGLTTVIDLAPNVLKTAGWPLLANSDPRTRSIQSVEQFGQFGRTMISVLRMLSPLPPYQH